MIRFSEYPLGRRDNAAAEPREWPWVLFAAWLSTPVASDDKHAQGFSPLLVTSGKGGRTSPPAGFLALEYDRDASADLVRRAMALLASFDAVLYTTASATAECPRFRVVLRTSRPIASAEEWRSCVEHVGALLGTPPAPESSELSRLWYRPITRCDVRCFSGGAWDVDASVRACPHEPPAERVAPSSAVLNAHANDTRCRLAREALDRSKPSGMFVACGICHDHGVPRDLAIELVSAYATAAGWTFDLDEVADRVDHVSEYGRNPFGCELPRPTAYHLTTLESVEVQRVDWLWEPRIARGTITLWMGEGGVSKSTAALDIAARISTGRKMPDDPIIAPARTPADVVVLSLEDAPAFTLKPRLLAAGADCKRVHLLESVIEDGKPRAFSFDRDIAVLETVIDDTGARLLIVDPLGAYLGKVESHEYAAVRGVLDPLAKLAADRDLAVLAIMHVNKGNGSAMHRAMGSSAFVQLVRNAFAVGRDPYDESDHPRVGLAHFKANIGPTAPTLTYELKDTPVAGASNVARLEWGGSCDLTADDVLRLDKPAGVWAQCERALIELLSGGERRATDCEDALRAKGFSASAVKRVSARDKFTKREACVDGKVAWWWSICSQTNAAATLSAPILQSA